MTTEPTHLVCTERFRATATQAGMVVNAVRAHGVELEQLVVRFPEPIRLEAVRAAFLHAHARHAALRSAFRWEASDGMLEEVFADVPLEVIRAEHADPSTFLESDRARGFDARRPPLHRVALLGRAEHAVDEGDMLVWTFHHAILDGRSYKRVLEEVLDELDGLPTRTPTQGSFADDCRTIAAKDFTASHLHFAQMLEGASTTPLPAERASTSARRHAETSRTISDTAIALAGAERMGISVANVVQAAWAWVLARRGRVEDVVFATTRSGRLPSIPDVSEIVGCLIDTLPFRVRVDQRASATSLLARVRADGLALRPHDHAPLTQLLASAGIGLSSLVVIERYDLDTAMRARWQERSSALQARRAERLPADPRRLPGRRGHAPRARARREHARPRRRAAAARSRGGRDPRARTRRTRR
jgi:hypothetical protein